MTKLITKLRRILKALAYHARLKASVTLTLPGFLKVEVEYSRDLTRKEPPEAS